MLTAQNNQCAICEMVFGDDKETRAYIDHCHVTGKVRQLLCNKCNRGLGHFDDDLTLVRKVVEYLEKHAS